MIKQTTAEDINSDIVLKNKPNIFRLSCIGLKCVPLLPLL